MKLKELLKNILPESFVNYVKNRINTRKFLNTSFKEAEEIINDSYIKSSCNNKGINWDNPITYNEKMNCAKLYNFTDMKSDLTDKYKVREYIKDKIGEEYLIPLIGCYSNFKEIDFDSLPDSFVIKCNHDSGSATVVKDKNDLDIKKLRNKYNYLLKRNFATLNYEMHYFNIIPKILIEEHIGENINDYKFLCFDGKIAFCWVDVDRFIEHKRNFYDLEWNLLDIKSYWYKNSEKIIEKPKNFDKMVDIAQKLSTGFDHVRVDLYDVDGKIYFGELTFTTENDMDDFVPFEVNENVGNMWKFDLSNRNDLLDKKIKIIKNNN